jgi:hypothetical protein
MVASVDYTAERECGTRRRGLVHRLTIDDELGLRPIESTARALATPLGCVIPPRLTLEAVTVLPAVLGSPPPPSKLGLPIGGKSTVVEDHGRSQHSDLVTR